MDDLIMALTIFAKYTAEEHPTICEHDTLIVLVSPSDVSDEDKLTLEELSFLPNEDDENFYSSRFGSA